MTEHSLYRVKDHYVNATEMSKQSGKTVGQYLRNQETQQYLSIISSRLSLPVEQLIEATRGRNGVTWLHPVVGLHFAHWLTLENSAEANLYLWEQLEAKQLALAATQQINKNLEGSIAQLESNVKSLEENVTKLNNTLIDREIAVDEGISRFRQWYKNSFRLSSLKVKQFREWLELETSTKIKKDFSQITAVCTNRHGYIPRSIYQQTPENWFIEFSEKQQS